MTDTLADLKQHDRERWLACLWAPAAARPALVAIHAFDLEQARIVAEAREPMLGEIRLAWWRERLAALAIGAPPPAQPILQALAADARPRGVDLAYLARVEEGVLPLLVVGPVEPVELAHARGAPLFVALAQALAGGALAEHEEAAARHAGWVFALAQLWRGSWGHAAARLHDAALPAVPAARSRNLPGHLRGLLALAQDDIARIAGGKPLAPAASAGRQWRLGRAAI